ncbi:MAG: cytochrome c oxidase subunit II [Actinomycetota bacterium]|nr:cytochrome c oxidase subunit II [Actinomycetota bacterium]
MRRRRWSRGSRVALFLGTLTVLLSGCSAHDAEKKLRFGWPTGITKQAEEIRVLWTWSSVAALVVGVGVWGLIFWCCIRYRRRGDDLPKQIKYNLTLEIVYSLVPFLIIAGLFYRTVVVEDDVNRLSKNPDVIVQVDAFKWNWEFKYQSYKDPSGASVQPVYPGEKAVADPKGNDQGTGQVKQIGCDEASSNVSYSCGAPGQQRGAAEGPLYLSTVGDADVIPVLVLPVNQSVRIVEHSTDVIHSFWVPEFLFKRDVIPYGTTSTARDNQFEFTPTSTGEFVGRCAELCGTYHSQMNFEVRVVTAEKFQKYLDELAKHPPGDKTFAARQALALQAAGLSPYATTTHPFNTDRTARSATGRQGG